MSTVVVTWNGLTLAEKAEARQEAGDWFVATEQPMPVGTRLVLAGDVAATVVVKRVVEGADAGMLVATTAAAAEPEAAPVSDENGDRGTKRGGGRRRRR